MEREFSMMLQDRINTTVNPTIELACVSNMYVRMMNFNKKGNIEIGHTHPFDHLTLLASGTIKMRVDGKETIFKAPKMIFIRKDVVHELEAMEDNTLAFCIHPLRNGDGIDDIVDPSMLPETSDKILEYIRDNDLEKYVVCEKE